MNTFNTIFQEFIYTRTYARWVEDENRRETWEDTVNRYMNFMKKNYGDKITNKEFKDVKASILNLECMTSMRALWSAGKAAESDNFAIYNCFGRETEFITSNGVKSFLDFNDGDKITVLTHKGNWKKAIVKNYGIQKLNEITYKQPSKGNIIHKIYATGNHRWILDNEIETTQLKKGDYLFKNLGNTDLFNFNEAAIDEKIYWCYGFVYGDGTLIKDKQGKYNFSMVRLCGEKIKYKNRFEEVGFTTSTSNSLKGDFYAYTGAYLKTLPNLKTENILMLKAFIDGLLCADASKRLIEGKKVGYMSIQQTGKEINEFLEKCLPITGNYITRKIILDGQKTNYGARKKYTSNYIISNPLSKTSTSKWKIVEIINNVRNEEVWCLEVEDDHSFTFPTGVATGNCAFTTIQNIKDFAEILYILMNGTGVGYSVERKFVSNLPVILEEQPDTDIQEIIFADSKEGWAKGFEKVLKCLWRGVPFHCDYSKIRPRGARLKTFGGRASGPEPLKNLIKFVSDIVDKNRGLKIQPIDAHDICCKVAEIVIVGGVRRSAEISLSDLTDMQMANAKIGEVWNTHPQRQLANNSVCYTRKPDIVSFLEEWKHLYKSKSGERGIFNRVASQKKANENHRREGNLVIGTNPCGEILLRDKQLCNLTEVVVRPNDTFETLKVKVKLATILGTWQAGLTDFKYVTKEWKENCEAEALLGVSLTGARDHKILGNVNDTAKKWLSDLKHITIQTNKKIAQKLNINRATAITCVKPSGTVSLLVDSSAGAHVRPTKTGYYLRRVRISATDPLFAMLRDQEVPFQCEVGQHEENCSTYVLEFPMKAPKGAKTKAGQTAKEQLEFWQMYRSFWCVSGDTKILTDKGHIEINNLIGNSVMVWNGEAFEKTIPFKTGVQKLYKVQLSNGAIIKCTEDHKFILKNKNRKSLKALQISDKLANFNMPVINNEKNLEEVDAYSQGFYSGDGFSNSNFSQIYSPKYCCIRRLTGTFAKDEFKSRKAKQWRHGKMFEKSFVPIDYSLNTKINWLAGIIDSDGNVLGNGFQITSIDSSFLEEIRLMLCTLSVQAKIKQKHNGIKKNMPDGKGRMKEYNCKPLFTLLVSGSDTFNLIKLGLTLERVKLLGVEKGTNQFIKIEKIEYMGTEETYCFTTEKTHRGTFNGVVLGQCEHNPSITIDVQEHEWLDTAAWVYKYFDEVGGLTFLPETDHIYQLAPNEDIDKETYEKLIEQMPKIDFTKLINYEIEDQTQGAQELACGGGGCELR